MRALVLLAVLGVFVADAHADAPPDAPPADFQPAPPPDPSQGERADGKVADRRQYNELLTVPRILLAPPRLLVKVLEVPVHGLLDLDAKYHWIGILTHILTSEDGQRGIRPVFRYISRFDPQLGVTYFDKKLLGPGSSLSVTFGAVLPALVFGEASIHPRLPAPYKLGFDINYLDRNDMLFAGVGPGSDGGYRVSHATLSHIQIGAVNMQAELTVKVHKLLRLHATQGWSYRFYGNGENDKDRPDVAQTYCDGGVGGCLVPHVDPKLVPGFYQGANYFWEQVGLTFDTRTGSYSDRYWLRFDGYARYDETPYAHGPQWFREHAMLSGGIPLGGHTRRLVLKLSMDLVQPVANTTIPFSELVVMGGPDDFRGAPIGRFHDYSAVLGTIEYRWSVWMWLDAALFNDWVGVFGRGFSGIAATKFVPDFGAGLVLHTHSQFLMRVQVAYGIGSGVQTMFATTAGF